MKKDDLSSVFWTIALIGFIRAFIVEPFKIPSGSMIPTLLVGDHLFVAKSSYDIGIPFTNYKFLHVADPKRGDVVVFEYPDNEGNPDRAGQYYIKRLLGLPGDKISFEGGVPIINGQRVPQTPLGHTLEPGRIAAFEPRPNDEFLLESLPSTNKPHWVQRESHILKALAEAGQRPCIKVGTAILSGGAFDINDICEFTVPPDSFLMIGDNRDNSSDGRAWGFVDRKLLKGRALMIWLSWNSREEGYDAYPQADSQGLFARLGSLFRWKRFGLAIN